MESLCYSANQESEDAYDVSTSLTHYALDFVIATEQTHKSRTIREMWDENEGKQETNQHTRHVVAQRCATPSRHPSAAAAATASLSTAASPAWSRSSCCPCQRLPSLQGRTVPMRKRPFRTPCKLLTHGFGHFGFEPHVAGVHGCAVSWVDVCVGVQYEKTCYFISKMLWR